jgi:hypothetical protein
MVKENDRVAIFHSIHRVMQAEKVLKLAGADILLIPVPRQLSSDCGLAIRYAPREAEKVEATLHREQLWPAELFCREGEGYRRL